IDPVPIQLRFWRADDLVILTLKLYNLAITSAAGGRRIAPLDGKKPAFLAVCHQPQAFAEEVFADVSLDETPSALAPNDLPAALRLAGRSRVV
ncbi:hypothetical protein, partial [Klebsiella aerogenes]